CHQYNSLPFSF
nr:immunoglobulin light chain junction region [Macaca mulatta]MOX24832.1 immunoglobulin light chain junction region [Macaca mulatta]MOX24965.1 immunoglobulin light chain junction region [Macaca mulatta]MOX26722.1 immunoglobulin light chain junction region [Macaca mulatta]